MLIKYIMHSLQLSVWFLLGGCIMSIQTSHAACITQDVLDQHTLKSLTTILRSQKNVSFQTISPERYGDAKSLFKQLLHEPLSPHEIALQKALPAALITLATQAGLCWQWLNIMHLKQNHTVLLFMEQADTAQGQGAYLFALKNPLRFVIQAPHQYFDYATGRLALQFFFEQNLRAITLNTVHRNQTTQSDLAHQANSLFSAFTSAYAEIFSEKEANKQKEQALEQKAESYLLQLHGFSNKHRHTEAGRKADIILSNGSRSPSLFLRQSQERMNNTSAFKVYLYGMDIDELGGSTNSSLAVLKPLNQQDHFIHIELSADTRKKLKLSRSQRDQLWSSWQP